MSISVLFQFQISITLERAPKKKWIHFKCKVHITVVQWALPQFMVLHSAAENMNQTKKTDWVITHSQSSQNGGGNVCIYFSCSLFVDTALASRMYTKLWNAGEIVKKIKSIERRRARTEIKQNIIPVNADMQYVLADPSTMIHLTSLPYLGRSIISMLKDD